MNYIQRAIQWIDRLISLIGDWQLKMRFRQDAARVQFALGTVVQYGDPNNRTNKHYVKLELDFLNQWAGKMPDVDIAMTLGRPVEGVKRKAKRIEQDDKKDSLDFILRVPNPGETENFKTIPSDHEAEPEEDDQE